MLDFIKDAEHDVTSSIDWGNYYDNLWTIDRKTARYNIAPKFGETWNLIDDEANDKKEKTEREQILLTTGASDAFVVKNIFDVAGNVSEYTNEAYFSDYRMLRGGNYYIYMESELPASGRLKSGSYTCLFYYGFRPALYIS